MRRGIRLVLLLALAVTPGRAQEIIVDWAYGTTGQGVGRVRASRDLWPAEIYVPAAYSPDWFWQSWAFDAESLEARATFLSVYPHQRLVRLEVGDVVGDGDAEVVAAYSDGTVRIRDERNRALIGTFQAPFNPYVSDLELGDLDGDGQAEILLSTHSRLRAYRGNGELLWDIPVQTGFALAVGQLDEDPQPEIALSDGRVVDALTLATQWQFSPWSMRGVEASDLDGDGVAELLVTTGHQIQILDVVKQSVRATIQADLSSFGAMLVTDVDGDGRLELVHANGEDVQCRDAATLVVEWQVAGWTGEPTSFALADVRGDGRPLLFWGTGADSTGPDRVFAADPRSGRQVFISHDAVGYVGPLIADVDGDGRQDLVVASVGEGSQINAGGIYLLDPDTGVVRRFEQLDWHAHSGTTALATFDLDGNGASEVFVGGRGSRAVLRAYRFVPGGGLETAWKADSAPSGIAHTELAIRDFDGDGQLEIAAGAGILDSSGEAAIHIYDLASGHESSSFATDFAASEFLPIDQGADGVSELVLWSPDCGRLELYAVKSGAILATLGGSFCSVSGDADELWAGDRDGRLWRLHVAAWGFVVEDSRVISERPIDALASAHAGVWVSTADQVLLVRDGVVLGRSPSLGYGHGASLLPGDSEAPSVWYAGRIAAAALRLETRPSRVASEKTWR